METAASTIVRALFALLLGLAACAAPAPALTPVIASVALECAGRFEQGGLALCRADPGAEIAVDGVARGRADRDGWAVIGFDRDAAPSAIVEARTERGTKRLDLAIAPRAWNIQRVDGLPAQTVTPTEPAVLAKIKRGTELKAAAAQSRADAQGWLGGFAWPVVGRISGAWGNQRILNGEPRQPHYGVDIAAPTGTPILAPAAGVVALAEPDLHFEGGLVVIDHGQGLLSYYLHMSRIDVKVGDAVLPQQPLGAVGATGRATGPHLCWRLRWRDRQLDPSQAIEALAVARDAFAVR